MDKEILNIYVRVSSDISVKQNNSIPAQIEAGIRKSEQLGMDYKIFKEEGKSASSENLDNRPVISALLDLVDGGTVKHLFVSEFDRLTRNETTKIYIKKVLLDNDVLIHTTSQTLNLKDDDQSFMVDLYSLLSTREIKLKNKRIIRSLEQSALQGKVGGGAVLPWGFRKGDNKMMIQDPEEIEVYKRIIDMSLKTKMVLELKINTLMK